MGQTDRLSTGGDAKGGIAVDPWTDKLGGFLEKHPKLAIRLGNWESSALSEKLAQTPIEAPIYVTGLARSGSTILLEMLARHPDVASHRYRDFPAVLSPWMWNWFVDRATQGATEPSERAHKDRIKVTPESPEAFEEVVWMAFFDGLHGKDGPAVLDREADNAAFEAFYRNHIRKLLLLRGGRRYLAKGNYNISRLGYLNALFADARFVVPVRNPVWHVASLMKQHRLFAAAQAEDARVLRHFNRAGHFEFGLGRRAVRIDADKAAAIEALWEAGEEAAGWAQLWALVYGHLARQLEADPVLAAATHVVRYEDLCTDPGATLGSILDHCRLSHSGLPAQAAAEISSPDYYAPAFSEAEIAVIGDATAEVASYFGYGADQSSMANRPRRAV